MSIMTISNLNDGINVKADPSAISDGELQDCIGFDLTQDGVLKTAGGLAVSGLESKLPTVGTIQWAGIYYIGSTEYVLATTSTGLYANGTLIKLGFTGRFKGVSFVNNIYLVNGKQAVRFNGTNCYQWGITGPTTVPIIAPGSYLTNVIDSFADLTTWSANKVNCTIAADAVIKKAGTQSMKVSIAKSAIGYSFIPFTKDLTKFDSGEDSSEKDYFRFWLYVDSLINLDSLGIYIDVGDGSFLYDFFSYLVVSPGFSAGLQSLGFGSTINQITQDTQISTQPVLETENPYIDQFGNPYTEQQKTVTVTNNITQTVVDPVLMDQVLSFWSRSELFTLSSGVWVDIKIPKNIFTKNGDTTDGWSNISKIKIEAKATDKGAVNIYLDSMQLVGGSDLSGQYYFTYSYARMDISGNVLAESAPAILDKQIVFAGPITFDRHPLSYINRPISSDPQVNGGILSCIGGSLADFWVIAQITNNVSTNGTLYDIGDSKAFRILHSQHNQPAPAGTDIVLHKNKIWMVGCSGYPMLFRSSDILADGTLAPEGWPTRNAYIPENNDGALTNIRLVNKVPVIKGVSGEWAIQVLDPTDYLQVTAKKTTHLGLIGPDAVVDFETSNIYPSLGGFVESDGASATIVLPNAQPLIDTKMSSAVAASAGVVSYFSFNCDLVGPRTAKIDLFRSKPRFTNINDILLEELFLDELTNKVYAVKNGGVYLLDSGYTNESIPGKECNMLLKSKSYKPGALVSWNRLELIHNTGGRWWSLQVLVDGVVKCNSSFMSTSRTITNFRDFGPCSGYELQFIISGTYVSLGIIYLPIRIYYYG